ncbi:MAG: AAC(3) family N-acetyltransferase [Kiloniellales bacterium]
MKLARREELATFWRELGVRPGGLLLCHSFLASLGKPAISPEQDLLGGLLDALGPEGTLFAPTFTYSYFKHEIYNRQTSPSTVGALGDLVRNHPRGLRNLDPNFSNAGIGPRAENFLHRDSELSFGPNSFYDRLVQADAQILLIGVDFTALPLFMHIERMNRVPYRYDKRFTGVTHDDGHEFPDAAVHSVRDLNLNFVNDRSGVGAEIEADPACRVERLGYGLHRLTTAGTVVRIAEALLARDPHSLIRFQQEAGAHAANP